MKWIDCAECETEFRVVSDTLDEIKYCPYCAEPIEVKDDEDEEEFEEDKDYETDD